MNYNRINNLTGWGVFLMALIVYLLTMAPTASYWDCGEFIACSNELEVPHPPGAPFFLLLGRIFAMFAFNDVESIAFMLNLLSVLSAAFTVLFTFWITTYLARRLVSSTESTPSTQQTLAIMAAGVVGGLTCTFADSFWFNAVEAEVYALSSFFTAIVVWLMFKWEARANEPGNERWIILIAYLMGLSIGVHLLNLLAIPALAFIYYLRKYEFTWRGFFITSGISVAILGIIQTFIIITTFDLAWFFERVLTTVQGLDGQVGGLGLPLGTGIVLFFLLLFGGLIYFIRYSSMRGNVRLNTILLSILVIYVGFASYAMIPIRSNANPPIDENNPENNATFLSYMKREQYGNRPLLRGPLYNKKPIPGQYDEVGKEYILDEEKGRYVEIGKKVKPRYRSSDLKLFPRMYESSRFNSGPHAYTQYVRRTGKPNDPSDDRPTGIEDIQFFFGYQLIHMYWRYFMWNFSGREGDTQDMGWESGLNFGKTSQMPEFIKEDPFKNHFYMIPFLLGLLGLVWQSMRQGKDALVVGLLFFFTGIAIVIYLNQYPMQPRERDYSFAGSFQTFAIWVGLSVIALYQLLQKYLQKNAVYPAMAIGLIAPLLMGFQGWDDHDRSKRYLAPESAYNLLNSLAPNAVLFTNGDNDTFPLWYLQEVEKVREDVRVLCLSYVNTDWYIDQMKRQSNQSPPLPIDIKDYVGQQNQSKAYRQKNISVSLPVNGQSLIDQGIIAESDRNFIQSPMKWTVKTRGGSYNYLELKDELILNLLRNVAKENWQRPIYFANTVTPSSFLNLDPFLRQEGLAYRILPLRKGPHNDMLDRFSGSLELDTMYTHLIHTFRFTNLDNPDVVYDENCVRMVSNYHSTFHRLASGFIQEAGRMEAAVSLLKTTQGEDINDSTQQVIQAQEQKIAELKTKAAEVMATAETRFPLTVATPDPYLIVRTATTFDQLGNKEKADTYYRMAMDRLVQTLQYHYDTGSFFPKRANFVQTVRFLAQLFSDQQSLRQYNRPEFAQELQTAMQQMPRYFAGGR